MNIKVKITTQENMNFYKCSKNTVIEIDLELYVATVVASEIGTLNLNAAKAQAIAARTYAVFKGVLEGKEISDSASVAQAYRAPRYNSAYLICIQGTLETAGLILTYNNKPINAVFSDCNGGRTYSSKEVWGGTKVYLVAQNDPWDAASGKKKNGHGVGLSLTGCKWAASHGVSYEKILSFYYPNTKISSIENEKDILKKIRKQLFAAVEEL